MTKFTDYDDWFEFWLTDKRSILETMVANMNADLKVGYNPNGNSILKQKEAIEDYKKEIGATLEEFVNMDERKVQRYCYYDLIKSGVIE